MLSSITAINLIQNLRRIQDTLLKSITDIYHGKFDRIVFSSRKRTVRTQIYIQYVESESENVGRLYYI